MPIKNCYWINTCNIFYCWGYSKAFYQSVFQLDIVWKWPRTSPLVLYIIVKQVNILYPFTPSKTFRHYQRQSQGLTGRISCPKMLQAATGCQGLSQAITGNHRISQSIGKNILNLYWIKQFLSGSRPSKSIFLAQLNFQADKFATCRNCLWTVLLPFCTCEYCYQH